MPPRVLLLALVLAPVAAGLVGLALWFASGQDRLARAEPAAHPVPELPPLAPADAMGAAWQLAPALLLEVYTAFAETEEGTIYDRLAAVAADEALVSLYLDRAGALAGGGLTGADQTVHEMQVTRLDTWREGATLIMDTTWEVIGTVGHGEHTHVRGNAYRATLTVAPVAGAWRIVGFELHDVDRTRAGEMLPEPSEQGAL